MFCSLDIFEPTRRGLRLQMLRRSHINDMTDSLLLPRASIFIHGARIVHRRIERRIADTKRLDGRSGINECRVIFH